MNRREAIQTLLMITTGAALIPPSLRGAGQASIRLKHLKIDSDQEELLAKVAETIIPATDTPGAKALGLHLFVLKMMDDCYDTGDQQNFMAGLDQLDAASQKTFETSFAKGTTLQREKLLSGLRAKSEHPAELIKCYTLTKYITIRGYKYSKYMMTELRPHKMIPDPYDGFYPASKLGGQA